MKSLGKMRLKYYKFLSLGVCLLLLITGCSFLDSATVELPLSKTPTKIIIERTPTNETTSIPTSSATPHPSSTTTNQPTINITHVPTTISTLDSTQRHELLLELVQNNADCKLPCWWGITPGETTWEQARNYLTSFASEINIFNVQDRILAAFFFFPPPESIFWEYLGVSIIVDDEIVRTIKTDDLKEAPVYFLPEILEANGIPDEIWMHTFNSYPSGKPPFTLILLYPEQGIFAKYGSPGELIGEYVHSCIQYGPSLGLWSPDEFATYKDVQEFLELDKLSEETELRYLPLDVATDMDIDTFYNYFKGTNDPVCIETPKILWTGYLGETAVP